MLSRYGFEFDIDGGTVWWEGYQANNPSTTGQDYALNPLFFVRSGTLVYAIGNSAWQITSTAVEEGIIFDTMFSNFLYAGGHRDDKSAKFSLR